MQKGIYEAQDFFMIRCPVNSYNKDIISLGDRDIIEKLQNDTTFLESIAVASLDLYNAVQKAEKEGDYPKELIVSLKKYLSRSSTRTSPYGLFCGIADGKFQDESNIQLSHDARPSKKACYLDMEWFLILLKQLEDNDIILRNVRVIRNESCCIVGSKLKYHAASEYGLGSDAYNTLEIGYNELVAFIWDSSAQYIRYDELVQAIMKKFRLPGAQIFNYLKDYIKNEILLTEIRECLPVRHPMDILIQKLDGYELDENNTAFLNHLKDINNSLAVYAAQPLGDGLASYLDLVGKMQAVNKTKDYINIVMQRPFSSCAITGSVREEIDEFLDFIRYIRFSQETGDVTAFKRSFLEHYGEFVEVPYLEVIDNERGIGLPYENEDNRPEENNALVSFLNDKVDRAMLGGERFIDLKKEDLELITDNNRPVIHTPSLEIYIRIAGNSPDMDDFKLYIGDNMFSNKLGCSFSRFADLLSDQFKAGLKQCFEWQSSLTGRHYSTINVNELSKRSRTLNICKSCNSYENNLYVNMPADNSGHMDLNDILIGYNRDVDKLYLRSKSLSGMVCFTMENMLKMQLSNGPIRLLREISYAYDDNPCECLYQFRDIDRRYIPEIRYGKTIIATETWRFRSNDFGNMADYEAFKKDFRGYHKKWKMSRYINLVNFDERLLLDLTDDASLMVLFKELRQKNSLSLTAAEQAIDWLTDDKQHRYSSEIVVPVLLKDREQPQYISDINESIETKSPISTNKGVGSYITDERIRHIGNGDWLYFKIYIKPEKFDELVGMHLNSLLAGLMGEYVDKYFFIKYSDERGFHIRLRFRLKEKWHVEKALLIFSDWFEQMIHSGICKQYVIDIYERELERYGGVSAIEAAEDLFYIDSRVVKRIIELKGVQAVNDVEFAMYFVYQMIHYFLDSRQLAELYLNSIVGNNEFRKEFKDVRSAAVSMLESGRLSVADDELDAHIEQRAYAISRYKSIIDEVDESGQLTSSKADILRSICHMFCNRFNGDREFEHRVTCFIRHALHIINEKEKHFNSAGSHV